MEDISAVDAPPVTGSYSADAYDLHRLVEELRARGFRVIGPQVSRGAIVLDEITSAAQFPAGWHDWQQPGMYRIKKEGDAAVFGYAAGPHAPKRFLYPSHLKLVRLRGKVSESETYPDRGTERLALFIRPCDMAAIRIQERVLSTSEFPDPVFKTLLEQSLLIVVNCTRPAATCFCASLGTGPQSNDGDLVITDLSSNDESALTIEAMSEKGAEILRALGLSPASAESLEERAHLLAVAAEGQVRRVDTSGLPEVVTRNLDSSVWERIGERCLSCANCTMVCPTCFCVTAEDTTDLTCAVTERVREWDSCFTLAFSHLHGGSVRKSRASRYRQWLTHKFSFWTDQFGSLGCVGCGRCIAWCPVGIDVTEELATIRLEDESPRREMED